MLLKKRGENGMERGGKEIQNKGKKTNLVPDLTPTPNQFLWGVMTQCPKTQLLRSRQNCFVEYKEKTNAWKWKQLITDLTSNGARSALSWLYITAPVLYQSLYIITHLQKIIRIMLKNI